MKFEYYPDTDSLYIEINPGRKSAPGGGQEVVGWGSRDIVIDVDGEGTPVGIDIDSFASEIVDLSSACLAQRFPNAGSDRRPRIRAIRHHRRVGDGLP